MSILLIIIAVIVILGVIITIMYVKAPPSTAYVLSGISKTPRILIGKGGIKVPFFERLDKVFLGQVTVDVKTSVPVPTNNYIDVMVDAVCKVRVNPSTEGMQLAAKNFLNMSPESIASQIQDSLEGNMREVVGELTLQNLVTNRDAFSDQIQKKANTDMEKLGLEILSCNIQNITDKKGLIEGLGADNTYAIRKNASITKANAERDIAIAEQEAKKAANDVKVKTETEIAERNNELAIRKADLKKASDTKQAEADAAYSIMQQEQQKTVNIKTVDARIEQTKREQILSEEAIKITQNQLKSEINAKADADKYQIEIAAQAELEQQKRNAEAATYQAVKEAEALKAKAEAQKYFMEQEAEGIRAKGIAEADAIEAKGIAEAKAIEKRYEAWNKFGGDLAKIEMLSKYLPEMAKNVAEPISAIDNLNIYGGDGSSSASKLSANVPTVIKQTLDTVKSVTGVDLGKFAQNKLNINNEASHSIEDFDDPED